MAEHVKSTKFPTTKTSAASTIEEAWFDETDAGQSPDRPRSGPILWVRSKDGDLVAIPSGKSLETLKKLIRRGRNP